MKVYKKSTDIFEFGKHKNKTIEEVIKNDPTYVIWADKNIESFNISDQLFQKAINRKWEMLDAECDACEIDIY